MPQKKFNLSSLPDGITPEQIKEKYQLSDADLEKASGGLTYQATSDGKYYKYTGGWSHMGDCYCCPKCKKTMSMLSPGLYTCLWCRESYWNEKKLCDSLNLKDGGWTEITKQEYDEYMDSPTEFDDFW